MLKLKAKIIFKKIIFAIWFVAMYLFNDKFYKAIKVEQRNAKIRYAEKKKREQNTLFIMRQFDADNKIIILENN